MLLCSSVELITLYSCCEVTVEIWVLEFLHFERWMDLAGVCFEIQTYNRLYSDERRLTVGRRANGYTLAVGPHQTRRAPRMVMPQALKRSFRNCRHEWPLDLSRRHD